MKVRVFVLNEKGHVIKHEDFRFSDAGFFKMCAYIRAQIWREDFKEISIKVHHERPHPAAKS